MDILELPKDGDRSRFVALYSQVQDEISASLSGMQEVTLLLLAAFVARGHVLLESPPGLGKTSLAKSVAQALGLEFKRIQFTPDLMPFDVIGSEKPTSSAPGQGFGLEFVQGPIFTTILLADEINRAPAKTQAALLEAMAERQVSVSALGRALPLPEQFFVIATQNPVEMEGTYELPEAQLDRFMIKLQIPVPSQDVFEELLARRNGRDSGAQMTKPVARSFFRLPENDSRRLEDEVGRLSQSALLATGDFDFTQRIATLARLTNIRRLSSDPPTSDRLFPGIPLELQTSIWEQIAEGISPRAALDLMASCRALAALEDRAAPDWAQIRRLAPHVLSHRLQFTFEGSELRQSDKSRELIENVCDALATLE